MAMAAVLQLPHLAAAVALKEFSRSILRKPPRSSVRSDASVTSLCLQFVSSKKRFGIVGVTRSSAEAEEDEETEHKPSPLVVDCCGNSQRSSQVGSLAEIDPETKRKSILERLVVKMQLVGVLIALAMVIGVRVASANVTGSPIDGKKKNSVRPSRPLSSVTITLDGSGISAADSQDTEDHRRIKGNITESNVWSGEEFGGKFQRNGIQRQGAAMAAEMDGTDEEALREFEAWKATPYALTVPLRLVGLRGSVPPVWLKDFASSQGKRVKVVAEFQGNLQNIFTEMSTALSSQQLTPKSALAADLVTIGDSWLGKAVSGGLIMPIENVEKYTWFQRLGTNWQTHLRRNEMGDVDPNGKVWAVPYRWGSVVIAYNRKKLKQHGMSAIEDWDDLWKPELSGRIAMIRSPRDVIGAVLKALGASYNLKSFETDVPGGRQAVEEKFRSLQHQVRLFDNIQYLKALGAGEVWVAVGWSTDVIPFAKRTSNITVITPRSGTSLWADLWAIPATPASSTKVGSRIRGPSPLVHQWLDFCLQSARATSFKEDVFVGASPLALAGKSSDENTSVETVDFADSSFELAENVILETDGEKLSSPMMQKNPVSHNQKGRNEFLEPLSPAATEDFQWLLSKSAEAPKSGLDSLAKKLQDFFSSRQTSGS